jgi:hypothetical protein
MWPWFHSATGETFCGRLGKHRSVIVELFLNTVIEKHHIINVCMYYVCMFVRMYVYKLTSSGVVCMYELNIDHPERPRCGSFSASSSPGSEPCEPFGGCYCELSALSMILYPIGYWDLPYLSCIAHVRYYCGLNACST